MTDPAYPKSANYNVSAANLVSVGFDELSRIIPLFPLTGTLLLPRGHLLLRIFEPRYLAMVSYAMETDRLIGMVQPVDANENMFDGSKAPATYRAGCVGRITMHEVGDNGTQHIRLTGICRFSTVDELPARRGYRRALVSYARYRRDLEPQGSEPVDRGSLFDALRGFLEVHDFDTEWDVLEKFPGEALVTSLAMMCPFEPREKQALLEAGTLAERAKVLTTLLELSSLAGEVGPGVMH
jgi:Lon protease-like protein